jgi:hypothetical protein
LKADDIARYGARAAADLAKAHLFALDSARPNALGGKRTNFYSAAAKSVEGPSVGGGLARVLITKIGLAQRWLGGVIKAGAGISSKTGVAARYLAIPARSEAYGRAPSEFNDLSFIPTRRGGALVQALQTAVKYGKKGVKAGLEAGGLVMFWLVSQVTQRPDPSVMPTQEEFEGAVNLAVNDFVSRHLGT